MSKTTTTTETEEGWDRINEELYVLQQNSKDQSIRFFPAGYELKENPTNGYWKVSNNGEQQDRLSWLGALDDVDPSILCNVESYRDTLAEAIKSLRSSDRSIQWGLSERDIVETFLKSLAEQVASDPTYKEYQNIRKEVQILETTIEKISSENTRLHEQCKTLSTKKVGRPKTQVTAV